MVRITVFRLRDFINRLLLLLFLAILIYSFSKINFNYTITTSIFDKFLCSNIFVDKHTKKENIETQILLNILKEQFYIFDNNNISDIKIKKESIEENIPQNIDVNLDNIKNKLYYIKYSMDNVELRNNTTYNIDYNYLLNSKLKINKNIDILIIHTHGSESYSNLEHTDYFRNEDITQNVVNVGKRLTNILKSLGYNVLHDTSLYDYPTYNGSYSRSLDGIEKYKLENPNIKMVIDLHRDALSSNPDFAPICNIDGNEVSRLMLFVGTDCGGMEHENWKDNLSLALKLHSAGNQMYPGIFREMCITNSRYNQHATTGSILLEVGATGNTMEQSLNSITYFAKILDEVLNEE